MAVVGAAPRPRSSRSISAWDKAAPKLDNDQFVPSPTKKIRIVFVASDISFGEKTAKQIFSFSLRDNLQLTSSFHRA
jgi:hypothetical protein